MKKDRVKSVGRIFMVSLFLVYCFSVAYMLFLREREFMIYKEEGVFSYVRFNANFIPFNRIREHVNAYGSEMLTIRHVITEFLRDFVLFMPAAVFLQYFFKKKSTWRQFFVVMILLTGGIELVQALTRTGAFDIDECILNLFGACIAFGIVRGKAVSRVLSRMHILEQ